MNIKIEDVVPFGDVLRALFIANYTGIIGLDVDYKNPWVSATFDIQKKTVNDMVGTLGMKKLNKGETVKRDKFMDDELPLTVTLDYVIGKCISAGTLTDTKNSFGLAAFNKAVRDRNIGNFHTSWEITWARINATGNAAALDAKGFTTAMQTSFKDLHDNAWAMNTTKIDLSQDINTLSTGNKVIVDTFLTTCMGCIKAGRTYAKSIGDKDLAKRFTFNGIKKSVEPTEKKKPRKLGVLEFKSRVFATNVPEKHIMQFTLETKGVTVKVCRQNLKTGVCSTGTTLVMGEMLEVVKNDIPGTGEFIVVSNSSNKKAFVTYLKISV